MSDWTAEQFEEAVKNYCKIFNKDSYELPYSDVVYKDGRFVTEKRVITDYHKNESELQVEDFPTENFEDRRLISLDMQVTYLRREYEQEYIKKFVIPDMKNFLVYAPFFPEEIDAGMVVKDD